VILGLSHSPKSRKRRSPFFTPHRPAAERNEEQRREVRSFYITIAPGLQAERDEIARYKKKLQDEKPYTTVPVMREVNWR
jgi:hypothetical protein